MYTSRHHAIIGVSCLLSFFVLTAAGHLGDRYSPSRLAASLLVTGTGAWRATRTVMSSCPACLCLWGITAVQGWTGVALWGVACATASLAQACAYMRLPIIPHYPL